jgi:hypothetical protein
MTRGCVVSPTVQEDTVRMAPLMSLADRLECEAMGLTALEALQHSVAASTVADTAHIDGQPAAIWGLVPQGLLTPRAWLWMLGTPAVQANAKALLKMSAYFVEWAHETYPVLDALIDSRHEKALRWVSWLGFKRTGATVPMCGATFIAHERQR